MISFTHHAQFNVSIQVLCLKILTEAFKRAIKLFENALLGDANFDTARQMAHKCAHVHLSAAVVLTVGCASRIKFAVKS